MLIKREGRGQRLMNPVGYTSDGLSYSDVPNFDKILALILSKSTMIPNQIRQDLGKLKNLTEDQWIR